jgi:prepilin-type N-terminal cleavage/methylation domain-containing protein
MNRYQTIHRQRGFNLMEVLIGIAVFAIGMLALGSFQGALTRSAADAKVRTVAANIAESVIESQRGFQRTLTDPNGVIPAYNDIVDRTTTVTRDGVVYTVTQDVTDYYYALATNSYTETNGVGALNSDYKTVGVTVSWGAGPGFLTAADGTTSQLGSGSIALASTISSTVTGAGGNVSTYEEGGSLAPNVSYQPGQRPDVVSLDLGGNKFKESLLPQPDVIRADELVETRFDVITFSTDPSSGLSSFLRREQFVTVSCECTLKAPPGDPDLYGRRPTHWAGDEYDEGHFVNKAYGVSANNQQSEFCDTCCRDHHDGGSSADDHSDTAVDVYDPFRPAAEYHPAETLGGDHKHYTRNNQGVLSVAVANDTYVEACRGIRVDGFLRVAQDFRQEDLNVFPADYLDEDAEVATYSAYVTGAANAYENASDPDYESDPPCIGGPSPCVADITPGGAYPTPLGDGELPTWTTLPFGVDDDLTQQLRSRGVYIDYLSYDLRTVIDCLRAGGNADSCKQGDVELDQTGSTNLLEIIPFFDVQLTFLNRWNETPTNTPVDSTNEALADGNTHSRGVVSRDVTGGSNVEAANELTMAALQVQSLVAGSGGGNPNPGTDPVVSGSLTESISGVQATDILVEGANGALCDRTPGGFECSVPAAGTGARVKIYGYGKNNADHYACLTGNTLNVQSFVINGINAHVFYYLDDTDPRPDGSGYNVNIQATACI